MPHRQLILRDTPEARFWSFVKKGPECWEWTGVRLYERNGGVGVLRVNHRNVYAPRFSYALHFGPIPPGMLVCHRCDNPPCVRPDHLFLGTARDNTHDAMRKGRLAHGERQGLAKLTAEIVAEIRAAEFDGFGFYRRLGRRYGVNDATIRDVRNRRTWKHVP